MSTAATLYADAEATVREGWGVLVDKLGIQKATQFIILVERGKGDSVQDIAEYWGDLGIEAIHNRVMEWKAKGHSGRAIAAHTDH